MTSPFDLAVSAPAAGLPVRLWERRARDGKIVSRLEFQSLEQTVVEVILPAKSEAETNEVKAEQKEEIEALDVRLQSQQALQINAARSEARDEARREWEEELEEKIAAEREGVLRSCEQFGRERARYFSGVEAEVVKLALAIAARVLHREGKLDPLLLAGVVRLALEKVGEDRTTVVKMPVSEVKAWRKVFLANQESSLQIVGDERLEAGNCVVDTNVG